MDVDKGNRAGQRTDEEEIERNLRTGRGTVSDEERDLRDRSEPRPSHVASRAPLPSLRPRSEGTVGRSLICLARPCGLPLSRG